VFDSTQAGRLQLAVLIGSAPGIVSASLNNAWAPIVYRAHERDRAEVLEHTGQNIAFLTALAAGFVACAAPFLLAMVAPPSYDPGALTAAVGLVAAGTVLSVPYLCNVHLVFVSGRIGGLAVVTPVSLVVGTLAAWVGSRALGLSATGIGMPTTYALMALGTGALARKVSSTRWHYRVLATPTVLGFALCALGALLPTTGAALVVRLALTAATVAVSLLVFRRAFAS
jgi:O-antigen/teichoic acid export membrane protein